MWIHKPSMRIGNSLCRKRSGSETAGESNDVVAHDMRNAFRPAACHKLVTVRTYQRAKVIFVGKTAC